jgi:hypothetical protein
MKHEVIHLDSHHIYVKQLISASCSFWFTHWTCKTVCLGKLRQKKLTTTECNISHHDLSFYCEPKCNKKTEEVTQLALTSSHSAWFEISINYSTWIKLLVSFHLLCSHGLVCCRIPHSNKVSLCCHDTGISRFHDTDVVSCPHRSTLCIYSWISPLWNRTNNK